ncbi:hypothetical protein H1R20_g15288, partial [Candolleomyces eurysporus]
MERTMKLNAQTIREEVDQRIAELESEIRALKTHRNLVADTSLLPPEILSNIFIALRRIVANGYSYRSSWVRVTHVCRHWRAVALDCPALWSDLLFVNPKGTEVMLQRAKNAPLTVKFAAYPATFNDILCKIASQTGRLREVELRSGSNTTLELPIILSCFESTAPILEKLVLQGVEIYYRTGSDKYHTLPADFLRGGAPSLRHLDVTRFAIHWDALPLSTTLTHLRLENVVLENRPTQASFLKSLTSLLRLETMILKACLPRSGDALHLGSLPITLPSLRILELQDFAAELRQFFTATQIPNKARVDIELSDGNPELESLGSLLSALRTSWIHSKDMDLDAGSNSIQSGILDLRIVDAMMRYVPRIMCWFSNHDLPPNFGVENPPANLVVSLASGSAMGINLVLSAIAARLDISSLQSLKIASNYILVTNELLALFKDLTKLDKIAVWKSYDTLSKFFKTLKKKHEHAPSFPALHSIDLHGIDFDEDRTGDSIKAVLPLIFALKSREKSHPTIKQFTMTQCINFLEDHWEALCEVLPEETEKYWDEVEDIVEQSDDDEEDDDGSELGHLGLYY